MDFSTLYNNNDENFDDDATDFEYLNTIFDE
jgi:hypothetical protein